MMGCKRERRKSMASTRHEPYPNCIPEDLIVSQILTQLPIKSLCRFKSVSKNWNYLISSYPFNAKSEATIIIQPENTRTLKSTIFMLKVKLKELRHDNNDRNIKTPKFAMSMLHGYGYDEHYQYPPSIFKVIGSCNGLACIFTGRGNYMIFQICNPTTGERRLIRGPFHKRYIHTLNYIGFAYNSSLNDYKVLVLLDRGQSALIFSLREIKWRKLDVNYLTIHVNPSYFVYPHNGMGSEPVLVGETLHWLLGDNHKGWKLLAFDSLNESFNLVPLPNMDDVYEKIGYKVIQRDLFLCKIRDCLCICWIRPTGFERERGLEYFDLEVWILEEYGVFDSWKSLLRLSDLHQYFRLISDIYPNLFELRNCGRDKDDSLFFILGSYRGMLMFNSHRVTYYPTKGFGDLVTRCRSAFSYTESLISPFSCGKLPRSRQKRKQSY